MTMRSNDYKKILAKYRALPEVDRNNARAAWYFDPSTRTVTCGNVEILRINDIAGILDMLEYLDSLINLPHTEDFFAATRIEAAHQINRWGEAHDAGKNPFDWFWLIGYLAQKAATAELIDDKQKALHHTISTAAVCLNWYRAIAEINNEMRPGSGEAIELVEGGE